MRVIDSLHMKILDGCRSSFLPRPLRREMEDALGTSFHNVTIYWVTPDHYFGSIWSGRPFASRDAICLPTTIRDSHDQSFHSVIAHELAHVCQKRLASRPSRRSISAPSLALEIEADLAVWAISRGHQYSPILSDVSDSVRFWGPAGHYYTVYFLSVAAGLDPEICFRNAIYTQLPDQVDELDATAAGMRQFAVGAKSAARLDLEDTNFELQISQALQSANDLMVQRGLHSLMGGGAQTMNRRDG